MPTLPRSSRIAGQRNVLFYGGRFFRVACDPGAIGGSRSFVPSVVLRNC